MTVVPDPMPGLVAVAVPRWASMMARTIARPSPGPPLARERALDCFADQRSGRDGVKVKVALVRLWAGDLLYVVDEPVEPGGLRPNHAPVLVVGGEYSVGERFDVALAGGVPYRVFHITAGHTRSSPTDPGVQHWTATMIGPSGQLSIAAAVKV